MPSLPLKKRFDRVADLSVVMLSRLALRLRLCRGVDGWRRGAGLVLRGEAAMFVLSAFGLNVWSDDEWSPPRCLEDIQVHLAHRLDQFLASESGVRIGIRRGKHQDHVEARRDPNYTLGFEPWVDGPLRFVRPVHWLGDIHHRRDDDPAADALLNFVCRVDQEGHVDVWVRVNHIGVDGAPIQELMTRLEAAWGIGQDVFYPTPAEFAPNSTPRHCAGRADLVEVQAFIDFSPLQVWRKRLNTHLPEPMTVSAALIWCLAHHPSLAGLYVGTTVEISANDQFGRGVGIIVVRPSDYFDRPDGLIRYVREFNHQLDLTRRRASIGCHTLNVTALMPARPAKALLRRGLEQGTRAMGSLGLTLLKDAKVFGAPIGDFGHVNGFIAVGSMSLPTTDGGRVGCVTIKGPAARIAAYPSILHEVMQRLAHQQSHP